MSDLKIYTTEHCQGCKLTEAKLAAAGVDFEKISLEDNPHLVEQFKAEGLLSAPIVETADGARSSGFRPDRIKAIIQGASAQSLRAVSDQTPVSRPPSNGTSMGRTL